jgi:hypothetical protein
MSSRHLHTALIVVLVILFAGLLGGTYGIDRLLTSKAATLTAAKAKDQALDQEQVTIEQAKKDVQRYANLNQIAQAVVPQDKNQAEAVREIVNLAADNGVTLTAINFPASTLGASANGTTGTTGTGSSSGTSGGSSSASGKSGKLSQLTPVKNIPGVYQLPITISNDSSHPVTYNRFISFLSDLEHNRRTAQVQTISLEPDTKNSSAFIFSLTLNEYIKP